MLPDHLDDLRSMRAISLECGLQDEYNLHAGTAMLHTQLERAGIEHRFELFEGKHGGAHAALRAAGRLARRARSGRERPAGAPGRRADEVARLLDEFNREYDEPDARGRGRSPSARRG